jgi:hypothetical protein
MTYTFLGKYPYRTPLSVTSNESRLVSNSLNLRRKSVKKDAQRFEFSITLTDGNLSTLHADMMAHWFKYGMETPFEIEVPQQYYTESLIKSSSTIYLSNTTPAGTESVVVVSSSKIVIPAGRFVRFANFNKLYVVKENIESEYLNGAHVATIPLGPKLVDSLPANCVLQVKDVKAVVLNEADNASFTYDEGVLQSIAVKFIEYLI